MIYARAPRWSMGHVIENQMRLVTETSHACSIKLELEQTKGEVEPEQNRVRWICKQLDYRGQNREILQHGASGNYSCADLDIVRSYNQQQKK